MRRSFFCDKISILNAFFEGKGYDEEFPELSKAVCFFKESKEGEVYMKSMSEQIFEFGQEAERVNTEREKKRADEAEARADEEKSRADEEKSRADEAEAEIKRLKKLLEESKK